jgi:phosphocarrier protein HPr
MIRTSTTINNKLGLHARASAKLTKLAGGYPCDVWISQRQEHHGGDDAGGRHRQ